MAWPATRYCLGLFAGAGVFTLLLALSPERALTQAPVDPPSRQFRPSIALSPALLFGGLAGNYESLAAGRHGLLVEGGYNFAGTSSGSSATGAGSRHGRVFLLMNQPRFS